MGWATPIYVDAQVEYRLAENCGCDPERDAQVEYRLAGRSDLTWIGEGLGELGLTAGTAVDPVAARALMNGVDWRTGEQLVRRKRELDPRGKLTGRVIVDAINAAAAAAGTTGAAYLGPGPLADRFARAERCVRRDGEAHLVPVADVERLAAAAGLNAETLYGAEIVAEARLWKDRHVDVGVRGVDVVIDLPKSLSAAYGTAPQDVADAIEGLFMESVCEAVGRLEEWAADRAAELARTPTPGQARAAAAATVLDAAEQLAATAAQQTAVAEQQAAAARHARGAWEQVARSLTKSRLALRLAGTSRKETEAIVQQHQAAERDAATAAHATETAARDAARRAWEKAAPLGDLVRLDTRTAAPRTPAELQQQLAAMREQLPAVAHRIDATIAADAAYLRSQAAEHLQRAGQHTAAAASIWAEQALRVDIALRAPRLHAQETQARVVAARTAAARQQSADVGGGPGRRMPEPTTRVTPPGIQ